MAGTAVPYDHLPFFYSDMFDLGYVGEVDSRLETIESWQEPNRKGIVAYVDYAGRPRGLERVGSGGARPRADSGRRSLCD